VEAVSIPDALPPPAPDTRSFMCGAFSEKGDAARELAFAQACSSVWSQVAARAASHARVPGGPGRATSAPRWPGIIVRGGFATFADTPITAAETAEAQLRTIAEGAEILHRG
jgi:hypothetical protein